MGKILLSDLPDRDVLRLIRAKGMPKFTPATIIKQSDLVVELGRVRTQDYTADNMENEPDGRCIAAPIMDRHRKVIASLSISGPRPRMTMARTTGMLKDLTGICRGIGEACSQASGCSLDLSWVIAIWLTQCFTTVGAELAP
jgi:IclR family acetate operon transcriptional repressor